MVHVIYAVLAVVLALSAYRSYARLRARRTAKRFGLDHNERVAKLWRGELETEDAAGPRPATAIITNNYRLALILARSDSGTQRLFFRTPTEVRINVVGPRGKRVAGRPAILVDFTGKDRVPFRLALPESIAPALREWQSEM
jgi:hypothetical protein